MDGSGQYVNVWFMIRCHCISPIFLVLQILLEKYKNMQGAIPIHADSISCSKKCSKAVGKTC